MGDYIYAPGIKAALEGDLKEIPCMFWEDELQSHKRNQAYMADMMKLKNIQIVKGRMSDQL